MPCLIKSDENMEAMEVSFAAFLECFLSIYEFDKW